MLPVPVALLLPCEGLVVEPGRGEDAKRKNMVSPVFCDSHITFIPVELELKFSFRRMHNQF